LNPAAFAAFKNHHIGCAWSDERRSFHKFFKSVRNANCSSEITPRPHCSTHRRKKTPAADAYGAPVPGKPGVVTSPFAPDAGYVEVLAFPTENSFRRSLLRQTFPYAIDLGDPIRKNRTVTGPRHMSARSVVGRVPELLLATTAVTDEPVTAKYRMQEAVVRF
jgi:hypothetical protein